MSDRPVLIGNAGWIETAVCIGMLLIVAFCIWGEVKAHIITQHEVQRAGRELERAMQRWPFTSEAGARSVSQNTPPVDQVPTRTVLPSTVEPLERLAILREQGALTEEEFALLKAKILTAGPTDAASSASGLEDPVGSENAEKALPAGPPREYDGLTYLIAALFVAVPFVLLGYFLNGCR